MRFALTQGKFMKSTNKLSWLDTGYSEKCFKQRAAALQKVLAGLGTEMSHAKALHVLSGIEGYTSFGAIKVLLARECPAFCPHCGRPGTLHPTGMVSCANIQGDDDSFGAEGEGMMYRCNQCSAQFTDWVGDAEESEPTRQPPSVTYTLMVYPLYSDWETKSEEKVLGENLTYAKAYALACTELHTRITSCVVFKDESTGEECAMDSAEWQLATFVIYSPIEYGVSDDKAAFWHNEDG
jgi:hypothetical protein